MSAKQPIDQGITWFLPQLDDLRLMRARYVQHAFKPHAHDYFVIGIIENGVQTFTHEGHYHITTPGKLIVINPYEVHTGEAPLQAGFGYRALYPSQVLLRRITREFEHTSDHLPSFPGGTFVNPDLFRLILRLHRRSEFSPPPLELEEQLTHFFVQLIHQHSDRRLKLKTPATAHQAVRRVRDYLEAHYAERVTLDDLSQQVHLTPYHLARLFRQEIGIPPHKYLEHVRVRQAEHLLRTGTNLAEVAYATGFSSQSHFTHTFKRVIGATPAQFAGQRKIL